MQKRRIIWILSVLMVCLAPLTALADGWHKEGESRKWNYVVQGKGASEEWRNIDGRWYHFDRDGWMQTGWIQDGDTWYFLYGDGAMATGWVWDEGSWYYLDMETGAMLTQTITPDGYRVGVNGAWLEYGNIGVSEKMGEGIGGGNGSVTDTRPELPEGEAPSEEMPPKEPNQAYCNYIVTYQDMKSGIVLGVKSGQGIKDEYVDMEFLDFEAYELCAGQPPSFLLNHDGMEVCVYYRTVEESTPSDADKISWTVRFVDGQNHNYEILKSLSGKSAQGTTLSVTFPQVVMGKDGFIWEAMEESPWCIEVHGSGNQKYYLEYGKTGEIIPPENPDKEAMERLEEWHREAARLDAQLTGGDAEDTIGKPWMVSNYAANERRVRELISMIKDQSSHEFYIIGKDYDPRSLIVGQVMLEGTYSCTQMDSLFIGDQRYVVVKIGIKRTFKEKDCVHKWTEREYTPAGCLETGMKTICCTVCGREEWIRLPASGHMDEDGDSICDNCGQRAFLQSVGDVIETILAIDGSRLRFVCLDTDYQGKMLYMAQEVIPADMAGKIDNLDYNQSNVRNWLNMAFANELGIADSLCSIERSDGDSRMDDAILLSKEELEQYRSQIPGASGGYLLRTTESQDGTIFAADKAGDLMSLPLSDASGLGIRPVILLDKPYEGEMEPVRWEIGDVQERTLGGRSYLFRCIDDDYSDISRHYRSAALFLCDEIIRSDAGSTNSERKELFFGSSNNYKKSNIRQWLSEQSEGFYGMETVSIGVNRAYAGSTKAGTFEQMDEENLVGTAMEYQLMEDKVFILSVEEAVTYKEYLWKFHGSHDNNPESQYSKWSKGYWLRTPLSYGGSEGVFEYGKEIYVVNTVQGNVHPADVKLTSMGIRPVFTMPQS